MSAARGPALRVVRRAAPAAAHALVFALSLVLAVVLHLDTTAGRRLVARQTSTLVSSLLVAGLHVESIDVLSPTRLEVTRATLVDRLGKPVLRAEGLEVRFGLITLLAGILGQHEVHVTIPDVRAERVFVWIRRDPASGGVTFETAFDTRGPKSPGPSKPVRVALPRIAVRTATVTSDFPGIDRAVGEVPGLAAGLDVSPSGVVLTLKSADTRIQKLFARDVRGRLDGELRFPGTTRAELVGQLGRVPIVAKVGMRGKHLDLAASSDGIEPEAMREVFAPWPLRVPLKVAAEAHGAPESMQMGVEGTAGHAKVAGKGTLRLAPEVAADLVVHGEDIDLLALSPSAPSTALDVDGNVRLALVDGDLRLSANGSFPESKLGTLDIPPLRAEVEYEEGKLTGTARLLAPALPAFGTFEVLPNGKVSFDARTDGLDLRALGRYGLPAEGRATARVKGSIDGGRLALDVDATLASPRVGAASARSVTVRGHVEGPASEPEKLTLAASATGQGLDAGGVKLATFRATSEGSLERQAWLVQGSSVDGGTLEASAEVAPRSGPELAHVRVVSSRGEAQTAVTAERVTLQPGGFNVQNLSLRAGKGDVHGSITSRAGRRVIDLTLSDLDVASLLRSFGLGSVGVAGRIDGRVELAEQGHDRAGYARFELTGGALPPLEAIRAQVSVDFAGADVKTRAELSVPELVTATLDGDGRLERSVLDPDALHALTGEVTLAFAGLDLERAGKTFLAAAGVELAGRADLKVRLAKSAPEARPTIVYELATHGLALAKQGEPSSGVRLDIDSAGELFTTKGSRVALELVDALGPWVAISVEHGLGPEALSKLDVGTLERALLDAPLDARINAYRRPIKMLGVKATSALEGTVAGLVHVTGTARTPEVDASAEVVGAPLGPNEPRPEVAVSLKYSASRETYSLEAHTVGERRVIDLTSSGHFGWVTHGLGKDWTAAGEAKLSGLELERMARLVDVPLAGSVSGRVSFDLDRRKLDSKGGLELSDVRVDDRALGAGSVRLSMGAGRAEATIRLGHATSSLEVTAQAALAWGDGGLGLDSSRPGMLRVTARDFDLGTLAPLARDTARRVSGRLNGRAEVDWGGPSRSGKGSTTLRANATVRDGTASLVAGGGLLQDIDVQALADGDGGPLRLTFSAAARSRKPNLQGNAALTFEGPRFKRLDAKLELDAFPLLYDGILMGRATTGPKAPPLELGIAANERGQTIDVTIPAVEVKLPESSDKTLIALDEDPAIAIHDAAAEPDEEKLGQKTDGTTILKVKLGQKVVVKRGALDVPVGAELTVLPDGRLDGSVTLRPGGVVPALGQTFRITRGTITFDKAEVRDGRLAIDASTRAADGTLIELGISGIVRHPHVALRSDPPRSQNEIVALLLGIQTDTTKASGGEQLGRTAMALAMNALLEGSPLATLQFGAGETSQGEAVSSVSMRVSNKVWLEGRTVKGSSTSINPSERVSGVVDWRFAPSWSLRTQLGDISGVELRWSLRY